MGRKMGRFDFAPVVGNKPVQLAAEDPEHTWSRAVWCSGGMLIRGLCNMKHTSMREIGFGVAVTFSPPRPTLTYRDA